MTKKTNNSAELARYYDGKGDKVVVTIERYLGFVKDHDKDSIADFIFNRLHSRYLKPFTFKNKLFKEQYKNGFSIMANCCLLIETLQSFKNGWGDSYQKSGQAFKDFFSSESNFKELKSLSKDFYENVRCGILHQGETCKGWRIDRANKKLIDGKTIHAVTFAKELENSLEAYCNQLKKEKWDSEMWDNLRTKMRRIISNCV